MRIILLLFSIRLYLTDCIVFTISETLPKEVFSGERKMFILNKNLVHLINGIFWNMGFKTETQAGKVVHVIPVARIISIISIIRGLLIMCMISIIRIISVISIISNIRIIHTLYALY